MDDVQCSKCGFLCARHKVDQELVGMPALWREVGIVAKGDFNDTPHCFRMAFELDAGMPATPPEARTAFFLQQITTPRKCPLYTVWKPSFSPKDHYNMIQTEEMMKWQADQKELDRKFQTDSKRSDRSWQIKVAVFAAALSLINALIIFLVARYSPQPQINVNVPPAEKHSP